MSVINGKVLFLLFSCCLISILAGPSKLKEHGLTGEDARREHLAKWQRVTELYRKDPRMKRSMDYATWYHKEMAIMERENTDPRPPTLEVPSIPFTCDTSIGISPEKPQSVHALRPGDINVVAALGDSITAGNGNGASTALGVLFQNRGESWCIGGDFSLEWNVSTIPNMLEKFNPDLMGHSECIAPVQGYKLSSFNAAVPGARAVHLPSQVDDLLLKMQNEPSVSYAKDWKMITLFIGGNDFCSYCNDREDRTPAIFKAHIQETLDKLHDQVPRAFVNLVPMAHVGAVQNVTFHHPNTSYPTDPEPEGLYPWLCDIFHNLFCPCVMNDTTRAELAQVQQDYFYAMKELVDSGRYDTKDDFTVVLQPHLKDQVPFMDPLTGMTDNRYFSPDCFHPNRRMHQLFAYLLYNVMLVPVGEKPYSADATDWPNYLCPTEERPYLYTSVNSVPPTQGPEVDAAWQTTSGLTTIMSLVLAAILGSRI